MKKRLTALLFCACVTMRTQTMEHEPDPQTLARASVGGKYTTLLLTFEAPEDQARYGLFNDYGYWEGHAYKGVEVPQGYWVYVAPVWYVWQQQRQIDQAPVPTSADPGQ